MFPRVLAATALVVPLLIGGTGMAWAGEDHHEGIGKNHEGGREDAPGGGALFELVDQDQSNETNQSNEATNTQVNPTIVAEDVLGLGAVLGDEEEAQPAVVENTIANDQGNDNATGQSQQ